MRETLFDYCKRTGELELLRQWNSERNGALTPETVSYGSKKKVWWRCGKGHVRDEEQLQLQSKYPGYNAHHTFHEGYKRELAAAANQIGAEGPSVKSLHTLNTLVGTLITHIRTEDKRVARHVKGG